MNERIIPCNMENYNVRVEKNGGKRERIREFGDRNGEIWHRFVCGKTSRERESGPEGIRLRFASQNRGWTSLRTGPQAAAGSLDIAVRVPSYHKTKPGIHESVSQVLVRQKGLVCVLLRKTEDGPVCGLVPNPRNRNPMLYPLSHWRISQMPNYYNKRNPVCKAYFRKKFQKPKLGSNAPPNPCAGGKNFL